MAGRFDRLARALSGALCAAVLPFVATPAMAATQWGTYQWQTQPNLKVYKNVVLSATQTNWSAFVDQAVQDWNHSPVAMVAVLETQAVDRRKCPARTGTVEVCNLTYGQNGWLGIAQIWISGNFILKGNVKLNDSYFNMSAYHTVDWANLVSCQELGHTIGLGHDDTDFYDTNFGTCMDYTSSPGAAGYYYDTNNVQVSTTNNDYPNANDYALLSCIYAIPGTGCGGTATFGNKLKAATANQSGAHGPELNSGPTDFGIRAFGEAPPPDFAGADPGNSPAQWGRAVAFTADGRGRVFEHEFAPGRKIITEVFWAPR